MRSSKRWVVALAGLTVAFSCTPEPSEPADDGLGGSGGTEGNTGGEASGTGGSDDTLPNEGGAGGTPSSGGSEAEGGSDGDGGTEGDGGSGSVTPSNTGWLVYTGKIDDDPAVLFGARLENGVPLEPVTLSAPLPPGKEVAAVTTLPGRQAVVYGLRTPPYQMTEIFLVDLSGAHPGEPIRINTPLDAENGALGWWTPDADENLLMYSSRPDNNRGNDLMVVDLTGPTPSVPAAVNDRTADVETVDFASWAGTSLVYTETPDQTVLSEELSRREIYMADVTDGAPADPFLISDDPSTGEGIAYPDLSPDQTRLVYQRNLFEAPMELFMVADLLGTPSAPVPLEGSLVTADNYLVGEWSPSSEHYAYRADVQAPLLIEAFLLDQTGTVPEGATRLNTALPADEAIGIAGQWSPNSASYAYIAAQTVQDRPELWVVDLSDDTPSAPQLASGSLPAGGAVDPFFHGGRFGWTPDSAFVWFTGDVLTDELVELFVARVTPSGVGARMRVNTALAAADSSVSSCYPTPGGHGLVYFADQLQPGIIDIFYASLDGGSPGAPARLNEGSSLERQAYDFGVTFVSDTLIAYGQQEVTDGPIRLHIVPTDGSDSPVPVSPEGVSVVSGSVWVAD